MPGEMELALPAIAPVIKTYSGALAAADVEEFTKNSTFMLFRPCASTWVPVTGSVPLISSSTPQKQVTRTA
jgi:hypothetical protein